MTRTFTGWHMASILVGFFAVIIGVNLMMARMASSTFGGVVVKNSYVASENFNRWLDRAAADRALGWHARVSRRADGRLIVVLTGPPQEATVSALARHPLGRLPDKRLTFVRAADGSLVSTEALPAGRWRLRLEVAGGGLGWRGEEDLP